MKVLKFAAIDIGSNAVRLLLVNVMEGVNCPVFKKSSLIRVPLRLGDDAFLTGKISQKKVEKLIKILLAFKNLMDINEVISFRACATSAFRDASNSSEIVNAILAETGIEVEVVDGKREAEIICTNQLLERLDSDTHYLYVDIGGGSTELVHFRKGKLKKSISFNIGTIRMLNNLIKSEDFDKVKEWIKSLKISGKNISIIGSGENINKILKISGKRDKEILTLSELAEIDKFMNYYTVEERVKVLRLNPDSADVIVHASDLFLKIMRWVGAKQIIVPTIGISDGIVHELYLEYLKQRKDLMLPG
ncbi:MAG: Ppx/GppA family phosphatase [Tenuifilaceae bacterium]|nr:ethanolamine ammonia-lyase reactivating factor EutA [Bacteroidales bacterium]MDI9517009.1 ethanolamine ammonia-lyase reactivating factor EutA [Bacteroidota bacterium]OQC61170.1 MAG: Guanosine-5'-triphosphate,3'-diphosphate pyrophosphatase [Bacteroidetes bacterium ADurb.Bin008]HNV81484.1 ethanolamine ammonia-lyase reactivating factor EutA [Tenuifilaceae bacterium]HOF90858.1 ethanolamine ammonia-lyase reactivating factor EutA [Tenuifilaceae bacterium]